MIPLHLWPLLGGVFLLAILLSCSRDPPPLRELRITDVGCSPAQVGALREAVYDWNKGIGDVIRIDDRNPDVRIISSSAHDPAEFVGRPGHGVIHLSPILDGMEFPYTLAALEHEIGHALGLGHSTSTTSIMWPYIDPYYRPGPSPEDYAAARALLGQ